MKKIRRYIRRNKGFCIFLGVLIVINILFRCVYTPIQVDGRSMEPTFHDGDRGLTKKYFGSEIKRYDVVIIENKNTRSNYWVKRVIGLPGETIQAKNGKVYINGKALDQKFLPVNVKTSDFGAIKLGTDEYYVLGDNRSISMDSRWIGPIKKADIIGKGVWLLPGQ